VHEGDGGAPGPGAGRGIDRGCAGFDHLRQRRGAVVDPVADMVETLAPLLEVLGDRRIGPGGGGQLDVAVGDLDEGLLHAVGVDDLAMMHLSAERLAVVGDCGFEIVDSNGDVIDFGELHGRDRSHHDYRERCLHHLGHRR